MKSRPALSLFSALLCTLVATEHARGADAADGAFAINRGDKAACRVIVLDDPKSAGSLAMSRASETVTQAVQRWSGVELKTARQPASGDAPKEPAIVLATLDAIQAAGWIPKSHAELARRVAFADEQAFACFMAKSASGSPTIFVIGRTPRGVFNGAVYLRDFAIDGPKDALAVRLPPQGILRTPQMAIRGSYAMGIYGVGPRYDVKQWKSIFDSFAEDGMDRVYFWTSGHYPSKKFPNTYNRDGVAGTQIGSESALRELIDHAHAMGIKFYIGSGVFAWCNAAYVTEGMPETGAIKAGGLCPSHPVVRERTLESLTEMYDGLPKADGMFLEVRDEHGECQCATCQTPVDDLGSKQYGVAEITFLQELATHVWRKHPHARFAWNIGYVEHASDPAYYRAVREMSDPRFEWLECRGSWTLPAGAKGARLPLASFTRQAIHWDLGYDVPLTKVVNVSARSAREGLAGYMSAFSPGFSSGDYYNQEVPYPLELVPYNVTRFAYREMTWEPSLSEDALRERVRQRFFGGDAPTEATQKLAADLWTLHDWVIAAAPQLTKYSQDWVSYDTRLIPKPVLAEQVKQAAAQAESAARKNAAGPLLGVVQSLRKIRDEGLPMLAEMEKRIAAAESGANPKALETLRLMRRAIDDTRRHFALAVPDAAALDTWNAQLAEVAK